MSNVVEFKPRQPRASYPGSDEPQPRFVIEIYDHPDGFDWHVLSDDEIGEDELSDYLGNMFFALNPDVEPGILSRLKSFFSNLFRLKGDQA